MRGDPVVRMVVCPVCSGEFEAKRSTAVYCSAACRQRGHRAGGTDAVKAKRSDGPAVVVLGGPGFREAVIPRPSPPAGSVRSVAAVTERTLLDADRLDTVLGQQALALAMRLDLSAADTGSAVASLSKELRAVLAEALAGVKTRTSALDELRERRDRKRGA